MFGIGKNRQVAPTLRRHRRRMRGVTLVEVMLAASILALMVLALFEGIAVSARIARENAEYLQADAYAFDLAWKRYNENYSSLRNLIGKTQTWVEFPAEEITEEAAPMLYHAGSTAKSYTTIRRITDPTDSSVELGVLISVDVEWGATGARRRLSATHTATVFKSGTEEG